MRAAIAAALTASARSEDVDPYGIMIEALQAHARGHRSPPAASASSGARDEWTLNAFAASLGVSSCVSEALRHAAPLPAGGEIALLKGFQSRDAIKQRLVDGGLVDRVGDLLWAGAPAALRKRLCLGDAATACARFDYLQEPSEALAEHFEASF